jgi:hypothetical protein
MEGHHDVTWQWDQRTITTRVSADPWNYGVEELLHGIAGDSGSGSGSTPTSVTVMLDFNPLNCTGTFITLLFSESGAFIGVE